MAFQSFPAGFVWGGATSAYQIEGATEADGRGESIWDRFAASAGAIEDGSSGAVACDHYHRWREDIALMKELGLRAYRFSIAWPRILPAGRGAVNQRGLDFYRRLVDELGRQDIRPFATLYHWDLPQALQDEGGWAVRSTAEAFVEYADVVSKALGGQVESWITHNEPWCISILSHQLGRHAPGLRDTGTALAAAHHVLLSHGWAVPVIRRNSPGAEVGITLNLKHVDPASPSAADADAARHFDGSFNRWFLDPLYGRRYPADMVADYAAAGHLPEGTGFAREGDMAAIAVKTDFLGVNYYDRSVVRSEAIPEEQNAPRTVELAPASEWTEMGWEVHAEGLYKLLARVAFDYQPPKLYVTENGASYGDGPGGDGQIRDERRVRYLRDHLLAARRAIGAGVPLAGYFVWSLLDNFEWERGYTQRFGVVWVDYETQRRVPKQSALWYRDAIAANGIAEERELAAAGA
ncbi:MAG TPA: GH1 family beta-glucosidase [Herpetosiphonaceae bacterium]